MISTHPRHGGISLWADVRLWTGLLVLWATLLAACGGPSVYRRARGEDGRAEALSAARVHGVLINGGASRAINYRSHLTHLRGVLDLLLSAGVPLGQIDVFASDGEDERPDLATRELRPEGDDGWLLDGTRLERSIGRPIEYISTTIDEVTLRPATREALSRWFDEEGSRLTPGDILFLYVTDHGTRGKSARGSRGNAISLWGKGEFLDVEELAKLLETLPRGVQVVTLMSQCFSGGFAELAIADSERPPTGRVCGYFSTTADREAYGCYPESRGDDEVGHSVRMLEAWRSSGGLSAAHGFAVVNDHAPDVPLRTSDEYARRILEEAAAREGRDPVEFADALLAEAWLAPRIYEPQIRLLDRLGRSFGFASARSLAEVDRRLAQLPAVADPLAKHADAWQSALVDLSRANLQRFLASHPDWNKRTERGEVQRLAPQEARALGSGLVAELGPVTRADSATYGRLRDLRRRVGTARAASYRMSVREAALLRMQILLIEVAATQYFSTSGDAEERRGYLALQGCEDFSLRVPPRASPRDRVDFPAYADDLETARQVLPGWMGIGFRQASSELRAAHGLAEGAVSVRRVYSSSPARAAGIEAGDVILGPPGAPFTEPRQIREWTMLSQIDQPRMLDVLRGEDRVRLTLIPGAHPGRYPKLPTPPGVGDVAPPLRLSAYRGLPPDPLDAGQPHLLFFWATWCAPCKAALPELLAYAQKNDLPIVAISDESREQLDGFLADFSGPFPWVVAMDRARATSLAYGISGTPTFVLVGGDGVVRALSTGYNAGAGLGLPGARTEG